MSLIDICNYNDRNMPSDDAYSAFNEFIFSTDIKLIGKLLHRFKYFSEVMHLPGDIVEIGVFKGSGIATFSKFIEIFCPHSNKKVLGFDIFDDPDKEVVLDRDTTADKAAMNLVYSKVEPSELSLRSVQARLDAMDLHKKYILIRGDVAETLPHFVEKNPGFRCSMIYIDVDLERPTYHALMNLWDRLLPGGLVIFDEFEYHKFSESSGVEQFLREKGLPFNVVSTNWIAPTAYIRKG